MLQFESLEPLKKILQDELDILLADRDGYVEFTGIAELRYPQDRNHYLEFLQEPVPEGVHYLNKNQEVRSDPSRIFPDAKSALCFVAPYPLNTSRFADHPQVASYAQLRDYHKFFSRILESLAQSFVKRLSAIAGQDTRFLVSVDTKPLLQKALHVQTGRGSWGKNGLYIDDVWGSSVLLGEILLAIETPLPHEQAWVAKSNCGTCRRCATHCPTGALDRAYKLDIEKCLSYWTIEQRGLIPKIYWKWLGLFWFGCDICQTVCPLNRGKKTLSEIHSSQPQISFHDVPLSEVVLMDQKKYVAYFAGTPLTRAGIYGLKRNAAIAVYVKKQDNWQEILLSLENQVKSGFDREGVLSGTLRQIREELISEA